MEPRKVLPKIIPKEKAKKALDKLQSDEELAIDGCQYVLIQEEQHKEMLDFMRKHFFPYEPLSAGIGLSWDAELETVLMTKIKQNLSLAMVSQKTGELISGVTYMITDYTNMTEDSAEKPVKLSNILQSLRDRCNIFQHYNVDDAIYIGEICTHKDFRGKGLATKIVKAVIAFLKHLGLTGTVVFADVTSEFSLRVFDKVGFDTLAEVMYSDCNKSGEIDCKRMGQHTSLKLVAKII